jgi:hypothetical protein
MCHTNMQFTVFLDWIGPAEAGVTSPAFTLEVVQILAYLPLDPF